LARSGSKGFACLFFFGRSVSGFFGARATGDGGAAAATLGAEDSVVVLEGVDCVTHELILGAEGFGGEDGLGGTGTFGDLGVTDATGFLAAAIAFAGLMMASSSFFGPVVSATPVLKVTLTL